MITASDLNMENDQLLKTKTTADQLGRVILTEQTEDGTNYTISSRKVYNSWVAFNLRKKSGIVDAPSEIR